MTFAALLGRLSGKGINIEMKAFRKEGEALEKLAGVVAGAGPKVELDTLPISKKDLAEVRLAYTKILEARPAGMSLAEAQKNVRLAMRENGMFGAGEQAIEAETRFNKLLRDANASSFDGVVAKADARAAKLEARPTVNPTRDLDNARLNILDSLDVSKRSNFKLPTTEFFNALRQTLLREEKELLVERIATREPLLSPQKVYAELRAGRPVTRDELNSLEGFYKKHFDTSLNEEQATRLQQAMPVAGMANGMKINPMQVAAAATSLVSNIVSKSGKTTKIATNVLEEWATGSEPNVFSRFANNLLDRRASTILTTSGLALATGLTANQVNVFYNPEGRTSNLSTTLFNTFYPKDEAFKDKADIANRQYDIMTSGNGKVLGLFGKREEGYDVFLDYTKRLFGQTYGLDAQNPLKTATDNKPPSASDDPIIQRQKLYDLSVSLASSPMGTITGHGLTQQYDIVGYHHAVAFYSGLDINALKDKDLLTTIRDHNFQQYATAIATEMLAGTNPARSEKYFREFLGGNQPLPTDKAELTRSLLDSYANNPASLTGNQILRPAIGEYLVLLKVLTPEQAKSQEASLKVLADLKKQSAENNQNAVTEATQRLNNLTNQSDIMNATGTPTSPQMIKDAFKKVSELIPELKGHDSELVTAFEGATKGGNFDRAAFDKAVKALKVNDDDLKIVREQAMSLVPR